MDGGGWNEYHDLQNESTRHEQEIRALVQTIPKEARVIVREDGGCDNAYASLAVSMQKLLALYGRAKDRLEKLEPNRPALAGAHALVLYFKTVEDKEAFMRVVQDNNPELRPESL